MNKLAKLLNEARASNVNEKVAESYYEFGRALATGFADGLMEKDAVNFGRVLGKGKELGRKVWNKLIYKEVPYVAPPVKGPTKALVPTKTKAMRGWAKSISSHPLRYGLGAGAVAGGGAALYYGGAYNALSDAHGRSKGRKRRGR